MTELELTILERDRFKAALDLAKITASARGLDLADLRSTCEVIYALQTPETLQDPVWVQLRAQLNRATPSESQRADGATMQINSALDQLASLSTLESAKKTRISQDLKAAMQKLDDLIKAP